MKMLNASIFSFIILKLVKKGILDFHITTATDICMKEVIDSCLCRTFGKIMETLKALILTIIVLDILNYQERSNFLLYCHVTGPWIWYRALQYR